MKYGVSDYVTQVILQDLAFNPGTPDCVFGPNTDAALIRFQRFEGLTQDGIAGSNTLNSLRSHVVFSGVTDTYGTYYNINQDGLRLYNESVLNGGFFALMKIGKYTNQYVAANGIAGTAYFCQ